MRRRELLGYEQGYLTVLGMPEPTGHAISWVVYCSKCDNTKRMLSHVITNKDTRSCGCLAKSYGKDNPNWKGVGDFPRSFLGYLRQNAKSRGLKFDLTLEYLWDLYLQQDRRCPITSEVLTIEFRKGNRIKGSTLSLDRIDPAVGYVSGNVWWVHSDVNFMKYTLTEDRFRELCRKVVEYYDGF